MYCLQASAHPPVTSELQLTIKPKSTTPTFRYYMYINTTCTCTHYIYIILHVYYMYTYILHLHMYTHTHTYTHTHINALLCFILSCCFGFLFHEVLLKFNTFQWNTTSHIHIDGNNLRRGSEGEMKGEKVRECVGGK